MPTSAELAFASDVLEILKENVAEGWLETSSEQLADLAVKHGLCSKVPYDRAKHGVGNNLCDCEPGDIIYWFGKEGEQTDDA